MSLIKRLEKQAKWHERLNSCPADCYSLAHEDARALLQEAADRIKGLSLLIEYRHHEYRRHISNV